MKENERMSELGEEAQAESKSIPIVDEDFRQDIIKGATELLAHLNKKTKKTNKELLGREYLRTLVSNPTPVNIILFTCGRTSEMKRIEED